MRKLADSQIACRILVKTTYSYIDTFDVDRQITIDARHCYVEKRGWDEFTIIKFLS